MKAVIVAAGRSSRLYPLTLNTPKGLLKVGEESILGRSVRLLKEAGVKEIAIVTGFQRHQMEAALEGPGMTFLYNPFFEPTNNLGSLWFARKFVANEAFLYLHSDIMYHPDILRTMTASLERFPFGHVGASLMVDFGKVDEEAMKVRVREGKFVESDKSIPLAESAGEWIGMAAFSHGSADLLFTEMERVLGEGKLQVYDTFAFNRMAAAGFPFEVLKTEGKPWIEIDFPNDLERAKGLFRA